MTSLNFPDMFSSSQTSVISDHEATASNLKLLLSSDKFGLFGDPDYGTSLKGVIHSQNSVILQDLIVDDIYTAIVTYMPQLSVSRKDITVYSNQDRTKLFVTINATNLIDNTTDLYEISLLDAEEI